MVAEPMEHPAPTEQHKFHYWTVLAAFLNVLFFIFYFLFFIYQILLMG